MNYARARLGLKKKGRTAATMDMRVEFPDGSSEERAFDSGEVLGPIAIPSYYEAGVLTKKAFTDTAPCDYHFIIVSSAPRDIMREIASVSVELRADSKMFARMLAKIALGMAVARFGVGGFEPTVREFILNPTEYGHWVGGFAGTEIKAPPSSNLHRIHLKTRPTAEGNLIFVEIQLFAQYGAPSNYVIVGRPLKT